MIQNDLTKYFDTSSYSKNKVKEYNHKTVNKKLLLNLKMNQMGIILLNSLV